MMLANLGEMTSVFGMDLDTEGAVLAAKRRKVVEGCASRARRLEPMTQALWRRRRCSTAAGACCLQHSPCGAIRKMGATQKAGRPAAARQQKGSGGRHSRGAALPTTLVAKVAAGPQAAPPQRQRGRCVEAQLFALLRQLASSRRRELLAGHFTEQQRLALERWILEQQKAKPAGPKKAAPSRPKVDACSLTGSRRQEACGAVADARALPVPAPSLAMAACADEEAGAAVARASSKTGVYGIQCLTKAAGRVVYRAKLIAGPFNLFSSYRRELEEARLDLELLMRIRRRIGRVQSVCQEDFDFEVVEARFRWALEAEQQAKGGRGPGAPELRFFCTIPARQWVGKMLRTPAFLAAAQLDAGLCAWRQLVQARRAALDGPMQGHDVEKAWGPLRDAFSSAWSGSRRHALQLPSRLQKLEAWRRARRAAVAPAPRQVRPAGTDAGRRAAGLRRKVRQRPQPKAHLKGFVGGLEPAALERRIGSLLVRWARDGGA